MYHVLKMAGLGRDTFFRKFINRHRMFKQNRLTHIPCQESTMSNFFTLRIPDELNNELREAAVQKGVTLTHEIKNRLLKYPRLSKEHDLLEKFENIFTSSNFKQESNSSLYPLLVEAILLLRGLIIQRDSQILRKVDTELDQLFGKKRMRIYD